MINRKVNKLVPFDWFSDQCDKLRQCVKRNGVNRLHYVT